MKYKQGNKGGEEVSHLDKGCWEKVVFKAQRVGGGGRVPKWGANLALVQKQQDPNGFS